MPRVRKLRSRSLTRSSAGCEHWFVVIMIQSAHSIGLCIGVLPIPCVQSACSALNSSYEYTQANILFSYISIHVKAQARPPR